MSSALLSQLRDARLSKSWSQRELSERAGIPQAHISRIESGAVDPKVSTLQDLARILDLDLVLLPRTTLTAVDALVRESAGETDRNRVRQVASRMYAAAETLQAMSGGQNDRLADAADGLTKLDLAQLPPWARKDLLAAALAVDDAIEAQSAQALNTAIANLKTHLVNAMALTSHGHMRPAYSLDDEA
jgi:transcriptional regulator with XRE-family HTH domain